MSLASLDQLCQDSTLEHPERIRRTLGLLLIRSTTLDEIDRHSCLHLLIASDLDAATLYASGLARRSVVETPEAHRWTGDDTLSRLFGLRGFAVPAATALLRDDKPAARAYGLEVLGRLRAGIARDVIARLVSDSNSVLLVGSDWNMRTQVSKTAQQALRDMPGERIRDSMMLLLAEYFIQQDAYDAVFDLLNGINATSAGSAENIEQWWLRAEVVWNEWWRQSGSGMAPPDREAWLKFMSGLKAHR